jgi:hypothetical protein
MDCIETPHPQPLSQQERGERIQFPFSPWEKGLGDEGNARNIALIYDPYAPTASLAA